MGKTDGQHKRVCSGAVVGLGLIAMLFGCNGSPADTPSSSANEMPDVSARGASVALRREERLADRNAQPTSPIWDVQTTPIRHGTNTEAYPAVGYLMKFPVATPPRWQGVCSGTLVSCNRMLTASHCFKRDDDGSQDFSPDNHRVYFQHAGLFEVESIETFCQSRGPSCVDDTSDLAIVVLKTPASIVPRPSAVTTDWQAGKSTNIVGFGLSSIDSDIGIKRDATIVPESCTSGDCFRISNSEYGSCKTDSGGPMLVDADSIVKILGVAKSSGPFCFGGADTWLDLTNPDFQGWLASRIEYDHCRAGAADPVVKHSEFNALTADGSHERTLPTGSIQINLNFDRGNGVKFDISPSGLMNCQSLAEVVSCKPAYTTDGQKITITRTDSLNETAFYQLLIL